MTSQQSIRDDLADGEERFKLLLDTLPHMAFALFGDGEAEYYNKAFITYHGVSPGPDTQDRTALLHPDDRHVLVNSRNSASATGREYIVEARLLRHDGRFRWHRIHNTPIIRNGEQVGWIGTAVDIHDAKRARDVLELRVAQRTAALQESEQRYRLLYNRTPLALHSIDRSSNLIDVNDTWTELFEMPREVAVGRSIADLMVPESAAVFINQNWPEMLASGGEVKSSEYRFRASNGRIFDARVSARGEFDLEGNFIRTWSATEDITAQKRAERELRQAQRMDAVGQLTAGIAHDFNNLLTAILGNLELLQRKQDLSARQLRLVDAARTAATRGARLTSQLLAFSRKQRITPEPVGLNAVVEGMRPLLQSTIGANITIALELDPTLNPAFADPTQLELAVLNLAINARDAMPDGGVLTLGTGVAHRGPPARQEEPDAGSYVALSVADTGFGMSDSVRERMFEPFFTTKETGKGSGLGLSHVLGVIKQVGGGVDVQSTAGEGTRITLYLPPAPAVTDTEPGPVARAGLARVRRQLRIMVVDDDPAVRRVTADMLREAEHEVLEYGSGREALAALSEIWPEALVADVAMPGMNGVELAQGARDLMPELPVLFITGFAEERLLPPEMGEQILRKPFGAAELDAAIARVVA